MKTRKWFVGCCVILSTLLFTACAASCEEAFMAEIEKTSQTEEVSQNTAIGDADAFVEELEKAGYYVQAGSYECLDTLKLASEGQLISCFGNNAGSDYFVVKLPPAPEQNAAKGNEKLNWLDEVPTQYDDPDVENYPANPYFSPVGWTFKLQEDEAIVLIGTLPPECRYFSFVNYVFASEMLEGKDYSREKGFFQIPAPEEVGNYHPIFGSISTPINNFNISSAATPNHVEGVPYGSEYVMIITGDKVTNEQVLDALARAGYGKDIVNENPLPAQALSMGLEKGKDTFTVLGRLSQCTSQEEREDYTTNIKDNTIVLRITPQKNENSTRESKPYGQMERVVHGTGAGETVMIPTAKQDLDTIRNNLIKQYGNAYTYEELSSYIAVQEEMTGYLNDRNSQGDNRDASYLMTDDFTLNSDEDFVVVYGINHTKTNKAVYSNAILYSRPMLNGVVSIYDSLFAGSSYAYLPEEHPDRDSYYVYKMARETNTEVIDDYTKIIEYSSGNEKGRFYGVDNGATLLLAYRAYVEKATGIAPAYNEIVHDRAIVFHRIK